MKNHSKFGKTNPAFERRFDQNLGKAFKSILCQENTKTYVHPACINFYSGTPIS